MCVVAAAVAAAVVVVAVASWFVLYVWCGSFCMCGVSGVWLVLVWCVACSFRLVSLLVWFV